MPRKTKEAEEKIEDVKKKKVTSKKTAVKKTSTEKATEKKATAKKATTKKTTAKRTTAKKSSTKKAEVTEKKAPTSKKTSTKQTKASTTKSSSKKDTKTKTATKKNTSSTKTKSSKKESKSLKKVSTNTKNNIKNGQTFSPEYYDLPFRYNKTVVKILAQTPNNLFIYWEISDEDRENLKNQYGQYFFEITKPVLIIHNETMNYAFEIDINDFANSWYLHVEDSNCEYKIELGRRPIPINYNYIPNYNIEKQGYIEPVTTPYIYVSSSNSLKAPNDHVLFNNSNKVTFRNIKNNQITEKALKDFLFINKDNQFINIYELYKFLSEEFISTSFDLNNPSSGNPGSMSFSSKFK